MNPWNSGALFPGHAAPSLSFHSHLQIYTKPYIYEMISAQCSPVFHEAQPSLNSTESKHKALHAPAAVATMPFTSQSGLQQENGNGISMCVTSVQQYLYE
ncbi:hypothetical protein XELAEV_18033651mg [Xenopus laevis]|uniref:Uncharacterized protein n=1 Tax=Xenopus laevis TaxID=8355 RepID=A0A974CJQ5_XENLA|nr:hypothetical protein XELAEV_18033651mg [Xenopus laevis]